MIAQFSIVPLGAGASVSSYVAKVIKIVDESGLSYRFHAMGTIVEGEWDQIMNLIKKCRDTLMNEVERVIIDIKIDDRKGTTGRIEQKIKSVEEKLGRSLKK
ncbi:MAG TPA: MTH1187 family thiamine-binding protein [Thermodesulfovibrio thiophilus]|uniref:MTH1187 family thiamine-binding protein n=1 Tax=Thermodesulfovibrio thiophilus TaxID=340095 RepID=UPI0017994F4F|nr:MTH1187 family thiamine-binding protein [Thermodesulfovibrio thiophilus]HHW20378.1 MTH1187 family thiamine-binding protein [Thermodesulfovibrio thiophilus]HOA82707.1 MTH1187 family thiamine-binding protein [Thermodesulfovibrio thiophilus]HQD35688.1 MTH1187 family thiamine-binding protein [Thermodesulfovibrio thiophilus]